jgi:hypothetical protein
MMGKPVVLSLLGASAMVALLGCAEEKVNLRPPIGELHDGLNMIETSDPEWGIAGAFVKNARVIYFETRVGAPKPDVYRTAWPNDPASEIDMRFVDQNGLTFYVQRGGDNYVDPAWEDDVKATRAAVLTIDGRQRELDFEMAQEAAQAFGAAAPASLRDHTYQMSGFAAMLPPSQDAAMILRAQKISQEVRPEVPRAGFSYGAWSWLETDLYSANTGCFAWICWAKHSATLMWDYEGYYNASGAWTPIGWVLAINACNHGRCYNELGYNCYSQGGWFWNATVNGEANHNSTAINGACQTPYDWDSGGWDHLCNDDSAYELWQAKNGGTGSAAYGTGGDGYRFQWFNASSSKGNSYFACDCGSFAGCDNDWGRPSCP